MHLNQGLEMTVSVVSATDSTVSDSLEISIIPTIADGQITVLSDKDSGKPGETINGNIIITNLGTSTDTMRINSVDLDCGLMDAEIELDQVCPQAQSLGLVQFLMMRLLE